MPQHSEMMKAHKYKYSRSLKLRMELFSNELINLVFFNDIFWNVVNNMTCRVLC